MATRDSRSQPPRGGAWKQQDGLPLRGAYNRGRSHPQRQWDHRCPESWEEYSVRVAWREAVTPTTCSVDGDEKTARVHVETGLLLIARHGFITTVVPAHWERFELPTQDDGG